MREGDGAGERRRGLAPTHASHLSEVYPSPSARLALVDRVVENRLVGVKDDGPRAVPRPSATSRRRRRRPGTPGGTPRRARRPARPADLEGDLGGRAPRRRAGHSAQGLPRETRNQRGRTRRERGKRRGWRASWVRGRDRPPTPNEPRRSPAPSCPGAKQPRPGRTRQRPLPPRLHSLTPCSRAIARDESARAATGG